MDELFFDPWRDFNEISRRMDELMRSFVERIAGPDTPRLAFVPQCDVSRTAREYLLRLALPGVLEEDIDLTIRDRIIIVRGERENPLAALGGESLSREIRDGYFERRFSLPFAVDPDCVHVQFSDGMLLVRVERREG